MVRSLLIPYDGSRFSERALTFAVPIALQHGATLVFTMAHALPPRVENVVGVPVGDPAHERDVRARLRGDLERVAKRVATKYRLTTVTQFRDGAISDEICAAVDETNSDLLVMTTHGRGGLSRLWLGSVTDSVLRRAPAPMLVVRTARPWALTTRKEPIFPRILVAVDGSPTSERAIEEALRLAGDAPVHLVLVRVEDASMAATTESWVRETIQQLNADYLAPLAARHRTATHRITTRGMVHSDPARAILEAAKEENAFLIAVATHGRTGVRRAVLGSVADKVIRGSPIPVLVCPPAH